MMNPKRTASASVLRVNSDECHLFDAPLAISLLQGCLLAIALTGCEFNFMTGAAVDHNPNHGYIAEFSVACTGDFEKLFKTTAGKQDAADRDTLFTRAGFLKSSSRLARWR